MTLDHNRANTSGLARPIYAGVFTLTPDGGFEHAASVVSRWLRTHKTVAPHLGFDISADFQVDRRREDDKLFAQLLTSDDGNVIAARLEHRDRAVGGGFHPTRSWQVDVTIERDGSNSRIAARSWFIGNASDPLRYSVPRFITELWRAEALFDIDLLTPQLRVLQNDVGAAALANLILGPGRNLPLILIADGCPLDGQRVTQDSIGLAHVFAVSKLARFPLMELFKGAYELQHGSASIFYPALLGSPASQKAADFESIISWQRGSVTGPGAYGSWMHDEMAQAVVLGLLNNPAHRALDSIKATSLSQRSAVLSTQTAVADNFSEGLEATSETLPLLDTDSKRLETELAELTTLGKSRLQDDQSLTEGLPESEKRTNAMIYGKQSLLASLRKQITLLIAWMRRQLNR